MKRKKETILILILLISICFTAWGFILGYEKTTQYQKGDINLDGKVDVTDFGIMMKNYNGETKIQECKLTEVPQY